MPTFDLQVAAQQLFKGEIVYMYDPDEMDEPQPITFIEESHGGIIITSRHEIHWTRPVTYNRTLVKYLKLTYENGRMTLTYDPEYEAD